MMRFAAALLAIATTFGSLAPAHAEYPERPIRVIVPFAAGGGADMLVRLLQSAIEQNKLLPQPLVVINIDGGGTSVGSRRVKDADPDGYEILTNQAGLLINQAMGRMDFGYADFEPISITGSIYPAVMVREDSGFNTLKDLMDEAVSKPDSLVWASNLGGNNHVSGLVVQASTPGAKFRFVQFGGGAKCFVAMKGGHAQVGSFAGSEIDLYRQQGLKALATLAPDGDPNHPELPTARSLGFDASFDTVQMWLAPKGTPPERVAYLNDVFKKAMQTEFMQQKLKEIGMTPTFMETPEMKEYLDREYPQLKEKIDQATKTNQ